MSAPFQIASIPPGHEASVFVVSVSGGKDSTATAAEMERLRRELGIDVRYVFSDTGWEYPQTYEHLATMERTLGITIDRVGVEGGMVAKIRQRAGFPARKQRWCTRELKVLPLRAYHDALMERESVDTVSVVGIRADESVDRSLLPEFGYDDMWGGYVWRPLINAVIPDVIALHHRHGVPVNPLYKMGFSRVGCTCIYASKEEIELTAEHFPERIDLIRELEHEAEAMRVERNAETPDRYAHAEATYFQEKMVERYVRLRTWVKADGGGQKAKAPLSATQGPPPDGVTDEGSWRDVRTPVYKAMHIDDIISWSRTSRGGRQLKVIREEPVGGCYRWGMCEPPEKT